MTAGRNVTPRRVPVAWEALEDAFENNAPEVHSYLNLNTGEVIRIVDGIAEPTMHARIASDSDYLRVDPVASREQYRWMERFIETVDDASLRRDLRESIDGKGAFRRFKDALMSNPIERERWFVFRSERLRVGMQAWLDAHGITAIQRPPWQVPTADDVRHIVTKDERTARASADDTLESRRSKARDLIELLTARDLRMAIEFIEFLRARRLQRHEGAGGEAEPDAPDEDGDGPAR
jgi:hypothetical protein